MKITKALTRLSAPAASNPTASDAASGATSGTVSDSPVFVLLHGWGSNEYDLPDLLDYCGAGSADFASLRAPIPYGMGGTWFGDWAHEGVPEGESLTRQAGEAAAAIDEWVRANIPDERRVVTMGFSQGGLLAAHMLRFDPERYAAAVSFSGWLAPGAMPGDDALAASRPPVFYGHGSADDIFPKSDVAAMSAFWDAHATLDEHVYPGMAHSINMDELRDVRSFLESHGFVRPRIW